MNKISRWWQGSDEAKKTKVGGRYIIIQTPKEWHWTAKAVRSIVFYLRDHLLQIASVIISAAVAYKAFL